MNSSHVTCALTLRLQVHSPSPPKIGACACACACAEDPAPAAGTTADSSSSPKSNRFASCTFGLTGAGAGALPFGGAYLSAVYDESFNRNDIQNAFGSNVSFGNVFFRPARRLGFIRQQGM